MSLSPAALVKLAAMWRELAAHAAAGDADWLKATSALDWATPYPKDKAAAFALFSLGRLAFGFAHCAAADRCLYAGVLQRAADLALHYLGAEDPRPAADRQLPFRADLDG
jgi:hypothetical protein